MVDEDTGGLDAQGSQHSEGSPAESVSDTNLDGYVPVSRMNETNAITRKKSFDKGYQRGREEAASGLDRQTQHASTSDNGYDRNQIKGMIEQEAQKIASSNRAEAEKLQFEDWGRNVEADFLSKSEKFKSESPEFDGKAIVEKAAALAPFAFAHSAGLDNSPAVWEHLLKDSPVQLHSLEQMVVSGNHMKQQFALGEIQKVSNRLKQNRAGKESDIAPAPVDRIEKSTHGVGRGDESSFDYFRNLHGKRRK